eukprot:TRINITY_DN98668_c0_g1_i1.p2 TRINITY_DN98668_c0_g1~~TRINITY_DN98668_c0_g1_i1.p2  ORF type:complete len:161 (-),score=30.43 TRINITY_DN98668_c0_g1_i1:88-570(-)
MAPSCEWIPGTSGSPMAGTARKGEALRERQAPAPGSATSINPGSGGGRMIALLPKLKQQLLNAGWHAPRAATAPKPGGLAATVPCRTGVLAGADQVLLPLTRDPEAISMAETLGELSVEGACIIRDRSAGDSPRKGAIAGPGDSAPSEGLAGPGDSAREG